MRALLALLPLALAGCFGEVGIEEEMELGAAAAAEIEREIRIVDDPASRR